jgi:hypothetical protein
MWALPANKKVLLDIFGKDSPSHLRRAKRATRSDVVDLADELILLWPGDDAPSSPGRPVGEQLPYAIVARPDQMREFMAWATTYIGGYRPFTAFFRVLEPDLAQLAFEFKEPSLGSLENPLVGLIIAEALTLSTGQRSVSALSLLPCESTYSHSFARALALGYVQGSNGGDPVSSPLAKARRLTKQPPRKVGDELLAAALRVLSGLAAGKPIPGRPDIPPFVWEACRELQSHGEVKKAWGLLNGPDAPGNQVLEDMRGSREQPVRIFEGLVNSTSQPDALTSSFVAGLLADQIAPGTFEHVDLLLQHLNRYPMALVWYGLCAGLHSDSEVQQIGNCLGRRLVRDLLASNPIISRPRYDISVGELEVYLDREQPLEFRAASQNYIAVELLPGVPAYMKWPVSPQTEAVSAEPKETLQQPRRDQRELPLTSSLDRTLSGEQRISAEQQYAIHDLERAVERLKVALNAPGWGEDNGRSDEDRKRRKRH